MRYRQARTTRKQRCPKPQNGFQWNQGRRNQRMRRHEGVHTNNVQIQRQGRDDVDGEEVAVDEAALGLFVQSL
jgi:hypothetical protein